METDDEKRILEIVLMRGRVGKNDFQKSDLPIVDSLLGRRVLVTVDSISSNSPRKSTTISPRKNRGIIVTYNTPELELGFMKKFILNFLSDRLGENEIAIGILKCLLNVCSVVAGKSRSLIESISIGDLSVTDIQKLLPAAPKQELIGMIIELQGLGYIARKKLVQAASGATGAKRRRAVNSKQLLNVSSGTPTGSSPDDDFEDLSVSLNGAAIPSYTLKFFSIIDEVQQDVMSEIVTAKYGKDGARVYQLLTSSNQKMESAHIADVCAISREDAMKYLHKLHGDSLCSVQEVPKIFSTGSSAGGTAGVSAMMRAVASAFWLYYIDKDRARRGLVTIMCQSIVNLRRRFRLEVTRQCKIEDRATVLTATEEAYLERVHAAQDTLEANAINLVPSLVFLLSSRSSN